MTEAADGSSLLTAACDAEVIGSDAAPAAGEFTIEILDMSSDDDGMAAEDFAILRIERDGSNAADTLGDVARLLKIILEYTTT